MNSILIITNEVTRLEIGQIRYADSYTTFEQLQNAR